MSIKTKHEITTPTWFITFTCFKWLPLFEITQSYNLVYNWLGFIREEYQVETLAFVIMPNHVHLLLYCNNDQIALNKVISNGKRFMAYELVKRLIVGEESELLKLMSASCSEKDRAKGQKHRVFEPSFDAKDIYTIKFLYQKLDYIHHNPVSGKWSLCPEVTDYLHSSAGFYENEIIHPAITITDYREYW